MRRILLQTQLFVLILLVHNLVFAQGEIGIGTTTPQEKLDVNGAVIVRGLSASSPTATGTIQYNTSLGWHEGWLSSGDWRKQENDYSYLSGTYASTGCGVSLTSVFGTYLIGSATLSPFYSTVQDKKIQYLFTATELTAAGYCAGDISMVGFNVISTGSTPTYNEFTIKLKNTSTTTLTTTFETGAVIAYGPSTIVIATGANNFTLTTPYAWDGTSNLLIELCYNNTTSGASNPQIESSTTAMGYNATAYRAITSAAGGCSFTTSATTSTNRPVIRITGVTNGTYLTTSNYYYFSKGIILGSPVIPAPYEHHGPGTITGEAIYDDNTLLSDYVFDSYFDGKIRAEDMAQHGDYKLLTLDEMIAYVIDNRHLPTIKGRSAWERSGTFSTGELSTQLWVTSETQAIYLIELQERMNTLEKKLDQLITTDR